MGVYLAEKEKPAGSGIVTKILAGFGGLMLLLVLVGVLAGGAPPKPAARASTPPKPLAAVPPLKPEVEPAVLPPAPPPELALEVAQAEEKKRQAKYDEQHKKALQAREAAADKVKREAEALDKMRAQELKKIEPIIQQLRDSGSIKKWEESIVWVSPLEWAAMNRDQKSQILTVLANYYALKTCGKPTIRILSYRDDSILGDFFSSSGVHIRR